MPGKNKTEVSTCELKRDGKASRWRDLGDTAAEEGLCGGELLKQERGNDRYTPWYTSRGTLVVVGWGGAGRTSCPGL